MPSKKAPSSSEKKRFGRKVAKLRSEANLTQEQLAELVALSARHMQAIEAGDYWPILPTLRKLRKALNASWEQLCDE